MRVDIAEMPSTARVWVYQASKELNDSEKNQLEKEFESFLESWETHGHPIKGAWDLAHNRFIIIAVDEVYQSPSGCSIDKSVRFIQDMENQLGTRFLEKSKVAVVTNENKITTFDLKEIKGKVAEGAILPNTLIFNNLVSTKSELEKNWKIPASQSWLSRYFSN